MKSKEHVPDAPSAAPWRAYGPDNEGNFYVESVPEEVMVAMVTSSSPGQVWPTDRADAHLIASAPDGHALALEVLRLEEKRGQLTPGAFFMAMPAGTWDALVEKARAVAAKAAQRETMPWDSSS